MKRWIQAGLALLVIVGVSLTDWRTVRSSGIVPEKVNYGLINLREDYFKPTGWSGKRFINYHTEDWGKTWIKHSGYTWIYNRGAPITCDSPTLVRWDYVKNNIDNYWLRGEPLNLTFYFREDTSIQAKRTVIYAPGHYPVHLCRGIPDPNTNPPANMGICGQDTCPDEPGFQKACSFIHGVGSDLGESSCKGWGSYRPYVYMPSEWNFEAWGNFHLEFRQGFYHIEDYNERCYGKDGAYEVNWSVTDCYLGDYRFGDTYTCEGIVSGSRPCEHQGDMVVVFQDETGPGWHGIERWYFQKDVGLVAIEVYEPTTYRWYFLCLDAQW